MSCRYACIAPMFDLDGRQGSQSTWDGQDGYPSPFFEKDNRKKKVPLSDSRSGTAEWRKPTLDDAAVIGVWNWCCRVSGRPYRSTSLFGMVQTSIRWHHEMLSCFKLRDQLKKYYVFNEYTIVHDAPTSCYAHIV